MNPKEEKFDSLVHNKGSWRKNEPLRFDPEGRDKWVYDCLAERESVRLQTQGGVGVITFRKNTFAVCCGGSSYGYNLLWLLWLWLWNAPITAEVKKNSRKKD